MKEKDVYKQIGGKIMRMRKEKGYSREKLAEYSNISTTFLYEIEKGKKGFTVAVLFRISKALGIKCDYFLREDDDGEGPDYGTLKA